MTDTGGAGAEQEVQTFKGAVSLGAGRGKTHSGSCHRLGGNFRPTAKEKKSNLPKPGLAGQLDKKTGGKAHCAHA